MLCQVFYTHDFLESYPSCKRGIISMFTLQEELRCAYSLTKSNSTNMKQKRQLNSTSALSIGTTSCISGILILLSCYRIFSQWSHLFSTPKAHLYCALKSIFKLFPQFILPTSLRDVNEYLLLNIPKSDRPGTRKWDCLTYKEENLVEVPFLWRISFKNT